SPKKYAWYKAPSDYKKRSRKNYDMDAIRGMYGSQKVKEDKKEKNTYKPIKACKFIRKEVLKWKLK
ncbi:hypothetical protein P7D42_12685, partial [Enterococcus dongliensis]|nr:hypothetical protein [Enterococcus dongliensis]